MPLSPDVLLKQVKAEVKALGEKRSEIIAWKCKLHKQPQGKSSTKREKKKNRNYQQNGLRRTFSLQFYQFRKESYCYLCFSFLVKRKRYNYIWKILMFSPYRIPRSELYMLKHLMDLTVTTNVLDRRASPTASSPSHWWKCGNGMVIFRSMVALTSPTCSM